MRITEERVFALRDEFAKEMMSFCGGHPVGDPCPMEEAFKDVKPEVVIEIILRFHTMLRNAESLSYSDSLVAPE
jgi:hypothetical protein